MWLVLAMHTPFVACSCTREDVVGSLAAGILFVCLHGLHGLVCLAAGILLIRLHGLHGLVCLAAGVLLIRPHSSAFPWGVIVAKPRLKRAPLVFPLGTAGYCAKPRLKPGPLIFPIRMAGYCAGYC